MKKGRILLLNGPSSAGKTTLAWELQTNAPNHWYWLPLDYFFDAVPSQLWDADEKEGFRVAYNLYHDCVKLVSDQGRDIIVDTVMYSEDTFASFGKSFAEYTVIMVKVTCPIEELNRREAARGDRDIGLAAGQAKIMASQQKMAYFKQRRNRREKRQCEQRSAFRRADNRFTRAVHESLGQNGHIHGRP